jgi:uncharacterized repeat protein (TIGR03943 family)
MTTAHQSITARPFKLVWLSRIAAASPPFLASLLILKLWLTGTLGYYVNNRTVWVVLVGAALFALVGVVALRTALRSDDEPHFSWRTFVFLLPVTVGLVIPARPLSAISGQSSSLGVLQLASHVSSGASGDTFPVWVGDLGSHPDPSWWAGRHATLVGFIADETGLPPKAFIVGRYLVSCCVVDATLLGFPVQIDRARLPASGAWVQVSGTFGKKYWTDPSGQQYPILQHATEAPVAVPSSPYLSP